MRGESSNQNVSAYQKGLLIGAIGLLLTLLIAVTLGGLAYLLLSPLETHQSAVVLTLMMSVFLMVMAVLILRPWQRRSEVLEASHQWEALESENSSNIPDSPMTSSVEIEALRHQVKVLAEKIDNLGSQQEKMDQKIELANHESLQTNLFHSEKSEISNPTHQKLEESLKEISILFNVSQTLTSSIDPQDLCEKIADVVLKNIELEDFAILLLNAEKQTLEVQEARGFKGRHNINQLSIKVGEGISGEVAQSKKAAYIADITKEISGLQYEGMKPEAGSFLCLPMLTKNNLVGVMCFSRIQAHAFRRPEMRMLTIIAKQVAIALENARLYTKTKELTMIDDLTKIYNRRYFHRILEMEFKRAKRFHHPLSLIMVDVDYFKKINDRFGHLEGDRILAELAAILNKNLREVDTLARYGGEEFAVVLPDTTLADAEKVGFKLKNTVEKTGPSVLRAQNLKLTVSMGVAAFQEQLNSMDELIDHADTALYQAKSQGRNLVLSYREDHTVSLRAVD